MASIRIDAPHLGLKTTRACKKCEHPLGWINGRTLRLSGLPTHITGSLPDVNAQVPLCCTCHEPALRSSAGIQLPFCGADGIMRTVGDTANGEHLDFCGFKFTPSALSCAQDLLGLDDTATGRTTANVEAIGRDYLLSPSPETAFAFSEAVCRWGRGGRVWGNFLRYHLDEVGPVVHTWLHEVTHTFTDEEAVTFRSDSFPAGVPKGLGVSFASKHLRLLDPSRFAVLDDVLSRGLGFALNPKGYALFMRLLREFSVSLPGANRNKPDIGKLESGIFVLVRQHVRSTD